MAMGLMMFKPDTIKFPPDTITLQLVYQYISV
jgi:hypothetical protein